MRVRRARSSGGRSSTGSCGLRCRWRGTDGELDAVVKELHDDGDIAPLEGYKWVHSVVNEAVPDSDRVGRHRVQAALRRVDGAAVDARKAILKKRAVRRVFAILFARKNPAWCSLL